MTSHETRIETHRIGAVQVITLTGPQTRNAITAPNYDRIAALMTEAARDADLRAVVLTGAGGYFCSGGNVQGLRNSTQGTMAEATARTDRLAAMIRAITECPLPVIAAVEGGAAGVGLPLVLACDMVVAAQDARFVAAQVRIGLTPDGATTWFLRAGLPRPLVFELCALGQPIAASRLAQAGMINILSPPDAALDTALTLANRLADGPPQAIATIKRLIAAAPANDLSSHLDLEADAINRARFGPEAAEGLSAFLEKRTARFPAKKDPT